MKKTGLVHIYTGEGKGKTTAAIGLAARAAGQGLKVLFIQFFKEEGAPSGEKDFLRRAPEVELIRSDCRHPVFTKDKTDNIMVKKKIRETFEAARTKMDEGAGLVVLDEIMSAVNGGWIGVEEVLDFLDKRPSGVEVVLTGRDAPVELVKAADYVTEMLKIKHPFDWGVNARKGIEF